MDMKNIISTDVCILGAGAAGLSLALKLPRNNKVTVISTFRMGMSSSAMAQYGISSAASACDIDAYTEDIINIGVTLTNKNIASRFVADSAAEIAWLEQQGVNFHKKADGSLCLIKEVGHNANRIMHVHDETGKEIMTVLHRKAASHDNINILYEHTAVDFVVQNGNIAAVKVFNILTKEFFLVKAKCFVLATGGSSGLFARHTNPARSVGGGVAIAWRAGCSIANMEFQHFYPVCFDHVKVPALFIMEKLYSKDIKLSRADGSKFMQAYDSDGKSLLRDISSRAIFKHIKDTGEKIYIDLTRKQKKWVKNCFPAFYRHCISYGFDITKNKIPVSPAAHYTCGGVVVDENCLTKFKNLYAVGEVACTSLSGASALCGTPVMECIVFANKIADHIQGNMQNFKIQEVALDSNANKGKSLVFHAYHDYYHNIQDLMWSNVGTIRSNQSLLYTRCELVKMKAKIDEFYTEYPACHHIIEIRNMVLTALIVTQSAILRKESRGVHYNEDYPRVNKDYDGVVTKLDASFINFDEAYSKV